MKQERKLRPELGERPLSARSLVLSVLLGTHPPRLPVSSLVETGELFGVAPGTLRVALSRMVGNGELKVDERSRYSLSGRLLTRQKAQDEGRAPSLRSWDGRWLVVTVVAERRSASTRAEFRQSMIERRFGELRDGVWLRPHNLGDDPAGLRRDPEVITMTATIEVPARELCEQLWDLGAWNERAKKLTARLDSTRSIVERGEPTEIPLPFIVAAAALRHLRTDPLLPPALLPDGWAAAGLREGYDAYERSLQTALRAWHESRSGRARLPGGR